MNKDMGAKLQCDIVNPAKCAIFLSRQKEDRSQLLNKGIYYGTG